MSDEAAMMGAVDDVESESSEPEVEDVTAMSQATEARGARRGPGLTDEDYAELDEEGFRVLMPGVRYKEVRAGTGPQAEYKQAVIASWTAALTDTGEVFEERKRAMLRVGDAEVPPGLELALRQQQNGTKCVCKAMWRFAYGDQGRPASADEGTKAVPPEAAVTWTIETHRLWYKECDDSQTPMEMLLEARNKKELGNGHFHHENWKKAGLNYEEVLKGLNPWNYDDGTEEHVEACEIYVHCGNNLVYALMKMDAWLKAEKAVCDVLTVSPEDKKSLYRAVQVAIHLSRWPEADAALKIAIDTWPNHRQFRELYTTLKTHKENYKRNRAKMSAKMSANLFNAKARAPSEDSSSSSDSDDDVPPFPPPPPPAAGEAAAAAAEPPAAGRKCALM